MSAVYLFVKTLVVRNRSDFVSNAVKDFVKSISFGNVNVRTIGNTSLSAALMDGTISRKEKIVGTAPMRIAMQSGAVFADMVI